MVRRFPSFRRPRPQGLVYKGKMLGLVSSALSTLRHSRCTANGVSCSVDRGYSASSTGCSGLKNYFLGTLHPTGGLKCIPNIEKLLKASQLPQSLNERGSAAWCPGSFLDGDTEAGRRQPGRCGRRRPPVNCCRKAWPVEAKGERPIDSAIGIISEMTLISADSLTP